MSKRNGKITRTGIYVKYEAEIFSAVTRKIRKETGELTGGEGVAAKAKDDAQRFLKADEMIVSVKVVEIWQNLYGMPEDVYYRTASILDSKRIK